MPRTIMSKIKRRKPESNISISSSECDMNSAPEEQPNKNHGCSRRNIRSSVESVTSHVEGDESDTDAATVAPDTSRLSETSRATSDENLNDIDVKLEALRECQDGGAGPRVARACAVCGDSAFGRNFGVASCESCKAFFRRNMHKDSLFGRCDGNCEVTLQSRTHCKRCRLKKCFSVGMKRELTRKMLTEKMRVQREAQPSSSTSQEEDSQSPSTSSAKPTCAPFAGNEDLYKPVVEEVLEAFSIIEESTFKGDMPAKITDVDFVNMIEIPTRKIVKMSKRLGSFKMLPTDDQIALLKGGIMELTWIISAMNFDPNKNRWLLGKSDQQVPLSIKSLIQGRQEMRDLVMLNFKFSASILRNIHGDLTILKLMLVICMFSSDRPGTISTERIHATQERYAVALYLYTLRLHADKPGLFCRVMQKLIDIRDVAEKHSQMMMSLNVGQLRPLIVEVFDLPKNTVPNQTIVKEEPPSD